VGHEADPYQLRIGIRRFEIPEAVVTDGPDGRHLAG
jgi:hypothetical protein